MDEGHEFIQQCHASSQQHTFNEKINWTYITLRLNLAHICNNQKMASTEWHCLYAIEAKMSILKVTKNSLFYIGFELMIQNFSIGDA